jgi:osmotically-inducible protein OsmY
MRRHRYAAVLALSSVFLLQGCPAVLVGGGVAAYTSLEDRRTSGTQIEDQGIESRAATRIADRFGERAHVNVMSFNRSLLLTGEAWDEATRDEIGKVAAAVPNVRVVTNEIQVGGLSSAGSRANDTLLTAKVRGNFLNSSAFSPLHVKVLTEAGVVYLMGLVTEAEADAITELARTTGGVRKVVKVFDYCKSTDELCKPPAPPSGDKPRPPRV